MISNDNEITTFAHCANCMPMKPKHLSPRDWVDIEAGFTDIGVQVWCKRCECNIMHIDFEGQRHPANTERKA